MSLSDEAGLKGELRVPSSGSGDRMSYVPLGGWLGNQAQARACRSVLRLESCVQPIVRGAHGTRMPSSEPEEGLEVPASNCLRPWLFCCRYHAQGIVKSAIVQASHLTSTARLRPSDGNGHDDFVCPMACKHHNAGGITAGWPCCASLQSPP